MLNKKSKDNLITYAIVIAAYAVFQILAMTGNLSSHMKGLLVPMTYYAVIAVALNLCVGILGELSIGHCGFMCIGAFASAFFSKVTAGVLPAAPRFFLAFIIGIGFAALFGFLIGIPVLRLKGDYLAIVTLAFGEIIRNLVNVLYVGTMDGKLYFSFLNKKMPEGITMLVDGAKGAVKIKPVSTFTIGFALIILTLIIVLNLVNSRAGRAIQATRDNRIAAESMGVSVTKYKMMAFVTAATLAGMAGALYGLNSSTVVPTQFTFNQSINVLVFVVLGGLGNVLGSVISATFLTVLPEVLREFADYRMLVYAVVLILVMIFTNNPLIRSMMDRLFKPVRALFSSKKKTVPGGDAE